MQKYINAFTTKNDGVYRTVYGEEFIAPQGLTRSREKNLWILRVQVKPSQYVTHVFSDVHYGNSYRRSYRAAVTLLNKIKTRSEPIRHDRIDFGMMERSFSIAKENAVLYRKLRKRIVEAKALGVILKVMRERDLVMARFSNTALARYPREDIVFCMGSQSDVARDGIDLKGRIKEAAIRFYGKHRSSIMHNGFSYRIGPYYFTEDGAIIEVESCIKRNRMKNLWECHYDRKVKYFADDTFGGWQNALDAAHTWLSQVEINRKEDTPCLT
jgi:hypothetical protein